LITREDYLAPDQLGLELFEQVSRQVDPRKGSPTFPYRLSVSPIREENVSAGLNQWKDLILTRDWYDDPITEDGFNQMIDNGNLTIITDSQLPLGTWNYIVNLDDGTYDILHYDDGELKWQIRYPLNDLPTDFLFSTDTLDLTDTQLGKKLETITPAIVSLNAAVINELSGTSDGKIKIQLIQEYVLLRDNPLNSYLNLKYDSNRQTNLMVIASRGYSKLLMKHLTKLSPSLILQTDIYGKNALDYALARANNQTIIGLLESQLNKVTRLTSGTTGVAMNPAGMRLFSKARGLQSYY
jgi:hypothetical protein